MNECCDVVLYYTNVKRRIVLQLIYLKKSDISPLVLPKGLFSLARLKTMPLPNPPTASLFHTKNHSIIIVQSINLYLSTEVLNLHCFLIKSKIKK